MSLLTTFLNLFKYNTATDGNMTFNIDTAINQPLDIIDTAINAINTTMIKKDGSVIFTAEQKGVSPTSENAFTTKGYVDSKIPVKYDSGWFAVTANTVYTKNHNFGTSNINYTVLTADNINGANQRPALGRYDNFVNTSCGYLPTATTTSSLSFLTGNYVGVTPSQALMTTGFYRILAETVV